MEIPFRLTSQSLQHQSLQLRLNMPKTMDRRDCIVKMYTHNLQTQLKDLKPKEMAFDDDIYSERTTKVKEYCQKKGITEVQSPQTILKRTWYLKNMRLLHCSIAKGGSTFWRRVFEVMRRNDSAVVSPFQLSYGDFKEGESKIPIELTGKDQNANFTKFMKSSFKFIFTRDPYSRIFSAFIDKSLSPLSYFWGSGKNAIAMFRDKTTDRNSCGADVTFDELIRYWNTLSSERFDVHIRPVGYTCDACSVDYDVIGKMETFQADTKYILKKAGAYGKNILLKDMSLEYKVDYIVDNVIRAYQFKKAWNRCISTDAGLQRLWRQLQIAGLIEITDRYSLTPEQSNRTTVTEYLNMALLAFQRSGPSAKDNKKAAFLQAYSKVPLQELEKLRTQYIVDFEMFDYDERPAELFERRQKQYGGVDFFDVLRLK